MPENPDPAGLHADFAAVSGASRPHRPLGRSSSHMPSFPQKATVIAVSLALVCVVDSECLVCRELCGDVVIPGGFLWRDAQVVAFHTPPVEEVGNKRPFGHLLVVTRRHVARLGDLTEEEAAAVGRAATRLARVLIEASGAGWVYSALSAHTCRTSIFTYSRAIPARQPRSLGTPLMSGRARSTATPRRSLKSQPV